MKWISSRTKLPPEGERVLTYIRKKFRFAVFDKKSGGFALDNGIVLWIEMEEIWWMKLTAP